VRWKADLLIIVVAVLLSLVLIGFSPGSRAMAQITCDIDCLSGKIAVLTRRVTALERSLGVGGGPKFTTKAGTTKENFKDIGGGTASGIDWTRVSGTDFSFDQTLYGNIDNVTWQGWMENGTGSVRLFDSTNGRGVDGSETTLSSSSRASFYSSALTIWRGQNQYYVQVKSATGGSVTVSGVRLRIISK